MSLIRPKVNIDPFRRLHFAPTSIARRAIGHADGVRMARSSRHRERSVEGRPLITPVEDPAEILQRSGTVLSRHRGGYICVPYRAVWVMHPVCCTSSASGN